MRGEWCYFKDAFTPETCNYILEKGLQLPVQDATIGVSGETIRDDYRRSKVRFIMQDNPDFEFLFDSMWKMARQANDEWFDIHIQRITYIQLAEYDESYQGEYKDHQDVFWLNGDSKYHRKLTAVVQLTDPSTYEGGNLELCDAAIYPNAEEVRSQGTVFFFPSMFLHRATPVTKGKRYSLACWFEGPKWR